jgi:hypothetical protein
MVQPQPNRDTSTLGGNIGVVAHRWQSLIGAVPEESRLARAAPEPTLGIS